MSGGDETIEHQLTGGNAAAEVVRVGDTVRKPWSSTTGRVSAYVTQLGQRGLDVPRFLGRDERGRQVLEFVPGRLALDMAPLEVEMVGAVGSLVRSIHDASTGLEVPDDWPVLLPPPAPPVLLCHNDLAPWNLVVDGDRLVFIDWDGAGPSTPLWDLAYAAVAFAHLEDDLEAVADRLTAFADGYGADAALREALPRTMVERAGAMHTLLRRSHETGREPWASMYTEGHGEIWRSTRDQLAEELPRWGLALADRGGRAGEPAN